MSTAVWDAPPRVTGMLTPRQMGVTLRAGTPTVIISRNGTPISTRQCGHVLDSLRLTYRAGVDCAVHVEVADEGLANAATLAEWILVALGGGASTLHEAAAALQLGRDLLASPAGGGR